MKRLFLLFSLLISCSIYANKNVEIYVWHSGWGGGEHYGHVSMKMRHSAREEDTYVSLWPSREERIDLPMGCLTSNADSHENYEQDCREERRPADSVYRISLPSSGHVDAMVDEWDYLRHQHLTWFAVGNNEYAPVLLRQLDVDKEIRDLLLPYLNNPLSFNCASIVNHLLEQGGFSLKRYVGGIHTRYYSPTEGLVISTALGVDVVDTIRTLDKFMHPDKVGYMARRAMVDQVVTRVNRPLNLSYYLTDALVDELYEMARDGAVDSPDVQRNIRERIRAIRTERDNRPCPCFIL